jgi:hypothetical protein
MPGQVSKRNVHAITTDTDWALKMLIYMKSSCPQAHASRFPYCPRHYFHTMRKINEFCVSFPRVNKYQWCLFLECYYLCYFWHIDIGIEGMTLFPYVHYIRSFMESGAMAKTLELESRICIWVYLTSVASEQVSSFYLIFLKIICAKHLSKCLE